jgi:hypothetical protein
MPQDKVTCTTCFRSVNVVKYGYGWIGICCGEIVYNSAMPPLYISSNTNLNLSSDHPSSNQLARKDDED